MPETNETPKQEKKKPSSRILRDRSGGVAKELLERNRDTVRLRKKIKEALRGGPRTVPDISRSTDIPTDEVFWHLMSMRKYGEVVEGTEQDGYIEYAVKNEDLEETD